MKTFKWVMAPILAVFIIGFIGAAQAEDFTFTVPLRLNNLHSQVGSVRVFCQALNASGTLVGGWHTIVPVGPTGNVSQDVVVAFNALPNLVASDATQYKCWFGLQAKGDQLWHSPNYGTVIVYKAKPGTALVPIVSGQIPKSKAAVMVTPMTTPRAAPITPR
jgi:hypothetical protein